MAVINSVTEDYNEQDKMHRIYVRTRFAISNIATLNRVAGRAALTTDVGQRALVAAAYDELGLELIWNDGPFRKLAPEEKYTDAQRINFHQSKIQEASNLFDIIPSGYLRDYIELEEYVQPGEIDPTTEMLYVWEIPYSVE